MLASLIFLGLLAHDPILFLPLTGFLLLGYLGVVALRRGWPRSMVWGVLTVIFAYVWLKKYTFLPNGLFIHLPYFTLGLSYIFFRVLHLLVESEDDGQTRRIGPGEYLLYTISFTTFVSGPLQRYDEFAKDQFAVDPIGLGARTIGTQFERLVRGFFKVNVLGMLLHAVQEDALARMTQPLPLSLKFVAAFEVAVVYPFFLYANFSGYIDIVIALARLMRVRLPENFNRPFSASSFLDFWSRWHMTLSNWLKTYVYSPLLLALMRRFPSRSIEPFLGVFCFFVTFFLIGVWHGRTSEFVVYGLLTGGGISINKLWHLQLVKIMGRKAYSQLAGNAVYEAFGRGLNFAWFAFTLFWFWERWAQIHRIFAALTGVQWVCVWLAVWLSATVVLAGWEYVRAWLLSIRTAEGPVFTSRYALTVYASALGLVSFVMVVLLNQTASDIVYKAF